MMLGWKIPEGRGYSSLICLQQSRMRHMKRIGRSDYLGSIKKMAHLELSRYRSHLAEKCEVSVLRHSLPSKITGSLAAVYLLVFEEINTKYICISCFGFKKKTNLNVCFSSHKGPLNITPEICPQLARL